MCFHLALDNILVTKVKAVEVLDNSANPDATLLAPIILQVLGDLPLIQVSPSIPHGLYIVVHESIILTFMNDLENLEWSGLKEPLGT